MTRMLPAMISLQSGNIQTGAGSPRTPLIEPAATSVSTSGFWRRSRSSAENRPSRIHGRGHGA